MDAKIWISVAFVLVLTGCATQPLTINYGPSSAMTVEGKLSVGDFRYIPGEGEKIKPNQIRNTALGSILFEKNIDEYIETALFTESRFVGIELNDSSAEISGEIKEFLIDDLGYSVDWTLHINYVIENCYGKDHIIEKRTEKFGNLFGALNEIIKLNIEELFGDPEFVECIQS